jgi:uncharacterized membrane protein YtjA (UPF0391 family)
MQRVACRRLSQATPRPPQATTPVPLCGTASTQQTTGAIIMLSWALTFFLVALVAALFGFGGIAAGAAGIAKILFVVFLVLAIASFFFNRRSVV